MFWRPPRADRYVRVRYFVRSAIGREWASTELVMPGHREDEIRVLKSYWDKHRDKAMLTAFEGYRRRRARRLEGPEAVTPDNVEYLTPIARFFSRRFAAMLAPDERLIRVEVWYGTAPNRAPGQASSPVTGLRSELLRGYFEGPVERFVGIPAHAPYGAGEREADISWRMEYAEDL
jgi:hypothetical protein